MRYYTLNAIQKMYRWEQPCLPEEEIIKRAKEIHKKLNTMDISWKRSNKRYYQKNVSLNFNTSIEIVYKQRKIEENEFNFNNYQHKQIASLVKQYPEIRSLLEYTVTNLDETKEIVSQKGKELLLCVLIDIDQRIKYLTPRQQKVVLLLKEGYQYDEISKILSVDVKTVASHVCQAIDRLILYLGKNRVIGDKQ